MNIHSMWLTPNAPKRVDMSTHPLQHIAYLFHASGTVMAQVTYSVSSSI